MRTFCHMRTTNTHIRPSSLISVFVVRCLDGIMPYLLNPKFQFYDYYYSNTKSSPQATADTTTTAPPGSTSSPGTSPHVGPNLEGVSFFLRKSVGWNGEMSGHKC